jgi:ubiquinone/menaquinone biosynthesis C-methylase UbiE
MMQKPLVISDNPENKSKLNLGSGKSTVQFPMLRTTHLNVDVRKYEGTDLICDMRTLVFADSSFTEVLLSDCLDHVTFVEAKVMLRKIASWLKPNGSLIIHTPNLRFLTGILAVQDNSEALKWLYGSDGEGSTNYESNIIRWCYSKESLRVIVEAQGLTVISLDEDCGGFGLSLLAVKK